MLALSRRDGRDGSNRERSVRHGGHHGYRARGQIRGALERQNIGVSVANRCGRQNEVVRLQDLLLSNSRLVGRQREGVDCHVDDRTSHCAAVERRRASVRFDRLAVWIGDYNERISLRHVIAEPHVDVGVHRIDVLRDNAGECTEGVAAHVQHQVEAAAGLGDGVQQSQITGLRQGRVDRTTIRLVLQLRAIVRLIVIGAIGIAASEDRQLI